MNAPSKPRAAKTVENCLDELQPRNIAQRLNAVMAEVDYVQKQPKKDGMQYAYVSHDSVTKLVRPILQTHGVVYYPRDLEVRQNGNRTEAVFNVRFENIDDRTDYIDVATFGYGVDSQDKGPGKAMSYGVKYALLKALGLETGDDPEKDQGPEADFKADSGGFVTPDQLKKLQAKADEVEADVARFCNYIGVESLKHILADQFEQAIEALEAKRKKKEPVNA